MTHVATAEHPTEAQLDFLWLELTNRCNMQCAHCSVSSTPWSGDTDTLTDADYRQMLDDARALGCKTVQFIGGEPTLNRDLATLIGYAHEKGFTTIQLYSNLFVVPPAVIDAIVRYHVEVKTSVYGPSGLVHDRVTKHLGSWSGTMKNIRQLQQRGVRVQAAIIEMAENEGHVPATIAMLEQMGVVVSGYEKARLVGRADDGTGDMHELCGECAGKTAFVGADGRISPCTMSTNWSVGTLSADTTLANILASGTNKHIREQIGAAVQTHRDNLEICTPKVCGPYDTCGPKFGPGPCAPSGCTPCYPKG